MNRDRWQATVRQVLRELVAKRGIDLEGIDNAQDLLLTGALDSIDFMDLLHNLEDRTGIALDLNQIDDLRMATIDGLVGALEAGFSSGNLKKGNA